MDAYKDTCSEYPPDHDTGWTAAPVDQYHAGDGIGVLWMYLTGKHYSADTSTSTVNCDLSAQSCVQAVKTKLDKLPAGATVLLPTPAFSDGYGTPMRYQLLGGKPLLLSAGPDATFGTGDDIRSDNR